MGLKGRLLHPGCGYEKLPFWASDTDEVRLDINPKCNPHIVASLTDMGDIGEFDLIYTAHTLEHLYPHEVDVALKEFLRVLVPGGTALIFVPDLEDARATTDVLYQSPGGPVCGLDLIYGMKELVEDSLYMSHHTGFIKETLEKALIKAGFESVTVQRLGDYNLMACGKKGK